MHWVRLVFLTDNRNQDARGEALAVLARYICGDAAFFFFSFCSFNFISFQFLSCVHLACRSIFSRRHSDLIKWSRRRQRRQNVSIVIHLKYRPCQRMCERHQVTTIHCVCHACYVRESAHAHAKNINFTNLLVWLWIVPFDAFQKRTVLRPLKRTRHLSRRVRIWHFFHGT